MLKNPVVDNPAATQERRAELSDFVDLFVSELPMRVAAIEQELSYENRAGLCRAAHVLKGAANGYRFGEVALYAGRIEALARDRSAPTELLERALDDLVDAVSRVQS